MKLLLSLIPILILGFSTAHADEYNKYNHNEYNEYTYTLLPGEVYSINMTPDEIICQEKTEYVIYKTLLLGLGFWGITEASKTHTIYPFIAGAGFIYCGLSVEYQWDF